jgi:hypothetical protein
VVVQCLQRSRELSRKGKLTKREVSAGAMYCQRPKQAWRLYRGSTESRNGRLHCITPRLSTIPASQIFLVTCDGSGGAKACGQEVSVSCQGSQIMINCADGVPGFKCQAKAAQQLVQGKACTHNCQ